MTTGNRVGKYSRKISVLTNDASNPNVQLECVANIKAAMKVEPPNIAFGSLARDAGPQQKTVLITRGDAGPLSPKIVSTGKPEVKAELRELEPGEKYELELTVGPPWPANMLRGTLVLETGVAEAPRETITYFANVAPRVTAAPNRFTIPPEAPEPLDLTAELRWSGGAPGRALEASTTAPDTTVELVEQGGRQRVVLHVPANYKPPRTTGYAVNVRTDDAAAPNVQIPIYVLRQPQPAAAAGAGAPVVRPAGVPQPAGRPVPQAPPPGGASEERR